MRTRIDKLTNKETEAMADYAKKWIEIGLKTGETDWDTFNKYMSICYEKANLKYPSRVVRVPSPFFGAHVASLAHEIWNKRYRENKVSVEASVGASVGASVEASVGASVRDSVEALVEDLVEASVGASVRDSVRASVEDLVVASVRASVGDSVVASVGDSYENNIAKTIKLLAVEYGVKTSWNYWLGGQFWVGGYWYWGVAFVNFFFDICKLKLSKDIMERAKALRKVSESVNYIWPNRDFIIVCARPTEIHRNIRGRLHNENGMAIKYPDGWGLYLLNGVRFSEELYKKIVSKKMPFQDILAIKDIDQRTQAMKFGDIRQFLKHTNSSLLNEVERFRTKYELWKTPKEAGIFTIDAYHIILKDPETGLEYMTGVAPEVGVKGSADECMQWKRGLKNKEDWINGCYA